MTYSSSVLVRGKGGYTITAHNSTYDRAPRHRLRFLQSAVVAKRKTLHRIAVDRRRCRGRCCPIEFP